MNLVLCFFIVIVCGYIGRQLAGRAAQRLDFFHEFESAMVGLSDSVTGVNLELCRALEAPCGERVAKIFGECAQQLRAAPQQRFAAIWRESFTRHLPKLTGLSREDTRLILDAGEAVEALCRNPSRSQAAGYLKRLSAYVGEMEADKRKKCRLFSAGGVLTGLLIALLVI
jgi:stage III sporulation protein AB